MKIAFGLEKHFWNIRTFSVKTSVADPVNFFWIRIRGSGLKNTDPDPSDPKRPDPTGSGSYFKIFLC